VYAHLKAEQGRRRLQILADGPPRKKGGVCLYAHLQTQIALRCLYEIETEESDRAVYNRAMTRVAHVAEEWVGQYGEFDALQLSDEWEYDWRKGWHDRKTDNIWIFHRQLAASGRIAQNLHAGRTIREPSEAMLCMLLGNDPAQHERASFHFARLLDTVRFDHVWDADCVNYIEFVSHLLER